MELKRIVVVIGILVLLLVAGCATTSPDTGGDRRIVGSKLDVLTRCDDGVICYWRISQGSAAGGMSCFRDADLIAKYCMGG